jgi:hypothetical protein
MTILLLASSGRIETMPNYAAGTSTAVVLLSLFLTVPQVQAAEFVLVKDGSAPAPIVDFEDAPPFVRQAAEELAGYIQQISGAKPKILD